MKQTTMRRYPPYGICEVFLWFLLSCNIKWWSIVKVFFRRSGRPDTCFYLSPIVCFTASSEMRKVFKSLIFSSFIFFLQISQTHCPNSVIPAVSSRHLFQLLKLDFLQIMYISRGTASPRRSSPSCSNGAASVFVMTNAVRLHQMQYCILPSNPPFAQTFTPPFASGEKGIRYISGFFVDTPLYLEGF